jgi:hypothetical protein
MNVGELRRCLEGVADEVEIELTVEVGTDIVFAEIVLAEPEDSNGEKFFVIEAYEIDDSDSDEDAEDEEEDEEPKEPAKQ